MPKYLKFVVPLLLAGCLRVVAQGTAFTYQGQLATGGSPTTGNYDFQFSVYDSGTNGNLISLLVTNAPVGVTNGLFTTSVDFNNGVFTGPARWLNIGVRTNGATTNAYTYLLPRQKLTAVPYAILSGSASNLLGSLQAGQLSGTVSAAQISGSYTGAVAFTSISNTFTGGFNGTFAGNGGGLTNLNGSMISTGTVADARLTTNVALLNANQTYSGANTMSNWNNSFTGSFYGNGLVGWNTVAGTTLAAVIDHGYVLTNSQLVSVTLPTSANIGDIIRIAGPGSGGWQISLTNNNQSVLGGLLTYNNVNWNQSSAASANWEAIASSSDGSRLVAAVLGGDQQGMHLIHRMAEQPRRHQSGAGRAQGTGDGQRDLPGVGLERHPHDPPQHHGHGADIDSREISGRRRCAAGRGRMGHGDESIFGYDPSSPLAAPSARVVRSHLVNHCDEGGGNPFNPAGEETLHPGTNFSATPLLQ